MAKPQRSQSRASIRRGVYRELAEGRYSALIIAVGYRVLDAFDTGLNGMLGTGQQVDDPSNRRNDTDDRKNKNNRDNPRGITSEIHKKVFHRILLQSIAHGTLRARPGFNAAMADSSFDLVVIGGGVAGLTATALAARAGARVFLAEHHNVPGGCASFFQRDGYRFDVGATVVNGFGPRGIHRRVFDTLGASIAATPLEPAMLVHLPGVRIARYGDARWRDERIAAFGERFEAFWEAQERIADRVWDFAARLPTLPADFASALHLARIFRPRDLALLRYQGQSIARLLPHDASPEMRAFIDLQLLITAQTSAGETDLAFGAAALDIAREGTYHLEGGIATIATVLARAIRRFGGTISYRTDVARILVDRRGFRGVDLADGRTISARNAVAAIPYENVLQLLGRTPDPSSRTAQRWSAVTAYAGLEAGELPDDFPLHHQVLLDPQAPLGDANSLFISLSAPGERGRARNGGRAVTISTHADPLRWEQAYSAGRGAELQRAYAQRMLAGLERAAGKRIAPSFFELGTPRTFERYTLRYRGLVGGTPQRIESANLRARSHDSGIAGLTLCGDTIFPGQSTVGVTLSAINAVRPFGVDFSKLSASASVAAGRPVSDSASALALRATIP